MSNLIDLAPLWPLFGSDRVQIEHSDPVLSHAGFSIINSNIPETPLSIKSANFISNLIFAEVSVGYHDTRAESVLKSLKSYYTVQFRMQERRASRMQ